ncbi:MAG: hypothetical protein HFF90_04090 [Oscillibacter sp.]|nr:hypothetical protein [Oscillibacter sp.]
MRQANTRREVKRRNAVRGAVSSTVFQLAAAGLLLWLRTGMDGVLSMLLLILAVSNIITVVPMWVSLRERLREIEGGEEEEAGQY